MSIQGGLANGEANAAISTFLATSRLTGEAALAERFQRAVVDLARFIMVVAEGHSVHAAAGVERSDLERSVEIALRVPGAFRQPRSTHVAQPITARLREPMVKR